MLSVYVTSGSRRDPYRFVEGRPPERARVGVVGATLRGAARARASRTQSGAPRRAEPDAPPPAPRAVQREESEENSRCTAATPISSARDGRAAHRAPHASEPPEPSTIGAPAGHRRHLDGVLAGRPMRRRWRLEPSGAPDRSAPPVCRNFADDAACESEAPGDAIGRNSARATPTRRLFVERVRRRAGRPICSRDSWRGRRRARVLAIGRAQSMKRQKKARRGAERRTVG